MISANPAPPNTGNLSRSQEPGARSQEGKVQRLSTLNCQSSTINKSPSCRLNRSTAFPPFPSSSLTASSASAGKNNFSAARSAAIRSNSTPTSPGTPTAPSPASATTSANKSSPAASSSSSASFIKS